MTKRVRHAAKLGEDLLIRHFREPEMPIRHEVVTPVTRQSPVQTNGSSAGSAPLRSKVLAIWQAKGQADHHACPGHRLVENPKSTENPVSDGVDAPLPSTGCERLDALPIERVRVSVDRAADSRQHEKAPVGGAGGHPQTLAVSRYGLKAGWVIAKRSAVGSRSPFSLRCLQLATGQWCPPDQATWFPLSHSAILYATDLGHEVGATVEIIHLTRT